MSEYNIKSNKTFWKTLQHIFFTLCQIKKKLNIVFETLFNFTTLLGFTLIIGFFCQIATTFGQVRVIEVLIHRLVD